jgi:hypothetical protein
MQVSQEQAEAKAKSEGKPFVTIVLQPDGTFATTIQGAYPIVMMLGHLEMLKAQIIQQSMMQAAMAQAQEAAKKAEKQIVLPNGPMPPRFPKMG